MSKPVADLNNSAAKFWVVPMLGVPTLSLPGLALDQAIKSAKVLKRPPSADTMTKSNMPKGATGIKSLTVSKGRLLNKLSLTAVPLEISNSVWPSGAALATSSPATTPPALGLLSITTG